MSELRRTFKTLDKHLKPNKVDRWYIKEYLHKRDFEPIFDTLKYRYYYAYKLREYKRDKNILKFEVQSRPEDFPIEGELLFLHDKVVLMRVGVKPLPEFKPRPFIVRNIKPVEIRRFEAKDGSVKIASNLVEIELKKEPWKVLFKGEEEVFLEEYVEGQLRPAFPVLPLSVKMTADGCHMIESLALEADEAIYGFGEQFGPLNKRGLTIPIWNSDTTYTAGSRSYKSIPFYISSRGYGLVLLTGGKALFEVGSGYSYVSLSIEVWKPWMEYLVIYGPSIKEILRLYTYFTGRPSLPPLWSFGFWMSRAEYKSRHEVEEVAEKLRRYRIPCDVIHIDPAWMKDKIYSNFEWNEKDFPNPREMFRKLDEMGFKVSLWEQPYIPKGTKLYEEALEKGYLVRALNGDVVNILDFTRRLCGIVDFTNPNARKWYKKLHRKILNMGARLFKTDMGEALPEDALLYNGMRGEEAHNLYALYYQGTVFEAVEEKYPGEGLVWGRAGCIGIQRFPVQWGGDSHSTFSDMTSQLWGELSYSLSGVPFWSHDIGGFQGITIIPPVWGEENTSGRRKPLEKLYIRWAQWGLLSPFSRAHGTSPREPWEYGDEALKIFRKFTELRYSLLPYIYSLAKKACDEGIPIARPLIMEFQDDPTVRNIGNEYMLGNSLLIIPVLSGNDRVEYYLPRCKWLDVWRGEILGGGRWIREKVPRDRIPIYLREGGLVPMCKPVQYVGSEKYEEIDLLLFPDKLGFFKYFFDGESLEIKYWKGADLLRMCFGETEKRWRIKVYDISGVREVVGVDKWEVSDNALEIEVKRPREIKVILVNNVKSRFIEKP